MAPRRAIVVGCRKVIYNPKSTPKQVLKALELYSLEKGEAEEKSMTEVQKIMAAGERVNA